MVGYFPGDILGRQLDEALRIDGEPGKLLNDKREWIRPAGVRINVERMQLWLSWSEERPEGAWEILDIKIL